MTLNHIHLQDRLQDIFIITGYRSHAYKNLTFTRSASHSESFRVIVTFESHNWEMLGHNYKIQNSL